MLGVIASRSAWASPNGMTLKPGANGPKPERAVFTSFQKLRPRNAIDFPLMNLAAAATFDDAERVESLSLVVSAMGAYPRSLGGMEDAAAGNALTKSVIDAVAEQAFRQCRPLDNIIVDPEWRRAMDVNVTGSFLVCKHAIPHMIAAGSGSIILMASQMGRVAYAGSSAYCTTKGALLQLAKGIALDYAQQGIRANALSPGSVATDRQLLRFADMETAQREWGGRHPVGRLGEPHEIADAEGFEEHCLKRLDELAEKDPRAFAMTKRYLRSPVVNRIEAAGDGHDSEFLDAWFSEETRERVRGIVAELRSR